MEFFDFQLSYKITWKNGEKNCWLFTNFFRYLAIDRKNRLFSIIEKKSNKTMPENNFQSKNERWIRKTDERIKIERKDKFDNLCWTLYGFCVSDKTLVAFLVIIALVGIYIRVGKSLCCCCKRENNTTVFWSERQPIISSPRRGRRVLVFGERDRVEHHTGW